MTTKKEIEKEYDRLAKKIRKLRIKEDAVIEAYNNALESIKNGINVLDATIIYKQAKRYEALDKQIQTLVTEQNALYNEMVKNR